MMRVHHLLLILSSLLVPACSAFVYDAELSEGGQIVETVPSCALSCMTFQVVEFCGSMTNTTCICTNTAFTSSLTPCVTAACNVTESLSLLRYQASLCDRPNMIDRIRQQAVCIYIMLPSTMIFVFARIFTRIKLDSGPGIDDWLMIGALCFYICTTGLNLKMISNGFGLHTYLLSILQVSDSLKLFWLCELSYVVSLTLTKLSLLWFFRRIFPIQQFRVIAALVALFVVASSLALGLSLTLQCLPFKGNWLNWLYKEAPYQCINSFIVVYCAAGISIVHDCIIICLPLPILWSLKLPWQKKANLLVMFCFGFFVVVCSIFRLPTLMKLQTSSDPSYDQAPIALWTQLELSVGIICGCLPAFRALIGYLVPSLKIKLSNTDDDSISKLKQQHYVSGRKLPHSVSRSSFVELTQLGSEHDNLCHKISTALSSAKDSTGSYLDDWRGSVPTLDKNGVIYGSKTIIQAGSDNEKIYSVRGKEMEGIMVKTTIQQTRDSTDNHRV